jgi:hypothetical protein
VCFLFAGGWQTTTKKIIIIPYFKFIFHFISSFFLVMFLVWAFMYLLVCKIDNYSNKMKTIKIFMTLCLLIHIYRFFLLLVAALEMINNHSRLSFLGFAFGHSVYDVFFIFIMNYLRYVKCQGIILCQIV